MQGRSYFPTRLEFGWEVQKRSKICKGGLWLLGNLEVSGNLDSVLRRWHVAMQQVGCFPRPEGKKKVNLHSRHTCGQLLMGTHCFFRHSVLPFTQAQMVQLIEDHISPSYGREHTILLSAGRWWELIQEAGISLPRRAFLTLSEGSIIKLNYSEVSIYTYPI